VGRRTAALAAALAAGAALAAPGGASSPRPAAAGARASLSAAESSILDRINAVRVTRGLRPLSVSREMVAHGYFAHESADGSSFARRIGRFYHYRSAGENIAFGCPDLSPTEAMEMWLKSPPHRRNILYGRFRQIGISVVHVESAPGPDYEGDPTTVVTTDFGSR
jgi:uncharacterized protein YkwD